MSDEEKPTSVIAVYDAPSGPIQVLIRLSWWSAIKLLFGWRLEVSYDKGPPPCIGVGKIRRLRRADR